MIGSFNVSKVNLITVNSANVYFITRLVASDIQRTQHLSLNINMS